ncbi:MAG: hypothetical protein JO276_02045 [Sphingomonadaceae bacterium]|nr:hypothetical protein [Sphingomonadaceae bacterium]
MGWRDWIFGARQAPARAFMLPPGAGFTFDVVGELRFQANLDRICGGKCEDGYNLEVTAHFAFRDDDPEDPDSIIVVIHGMPVGYIPTDYSAHLRRGILRANPERQPVACRAKIVGGWYR